MHFASIGDLADVEPVLEERSERSHAEADAAALLAIAAAVDCLFIWFQTFVFRRKEALAVLLANRLTP
jgi:hypothetical protein